MQPEVEDVRKGQCVRQFKPFETVSMRAWQWCMAHKAGRSRCEGKKRTQSV